VIHDAFGGTDGRQRRRFVKRQTLRFQPSTSALSA
jgi:hypothetical protein